MAVGFAQGAEAGLALLPDDPRLARYAPLYAARFELLRRVGDEAAAADALQAAIDLSPARPNHALELKGQSL